MSWNSRSLLPGLLVAVAALAPAAGPQRGGEPDAAQGQDPVEAAQELYNNTAVVAYNITNESKAFTDAFPTLYLWRVIEPQGWPGIRHSMAWSGTDGYDVTTEFNTLLTLTGALIDSAAKAVKYAKALAENGNTELQEWRGVVNSTHSNDLNRSISDPSASQLLAGWNATLSTWSAENGVLANWTIEFGLTDVKFGKWRMNATQVGNYSFEINGVNHEAGRWLNNTYSLTGHNLTSWREENGTLHRLKFAADLFNQPLSNVSDEKNYDNSTWRAFYPTAELPANQTPIVDVGKAMAKGGVSAYANQTTKNGITGSPCFNVTNPEVNWGFVSKDRDCELRIVIWDAKNYTMPYVSQMGATAGGGDDVNISVTLAIKELLNAKGLYLNVTNETKHNLNAIGRMVMGHEHFHVLQYGINGRDPGWNVWVEGQPRFTQTIHVPDVEDDATSFWKNEAGGFLRKPQDPLCNINPNALDNLRNPKRNDHAFALYWGYLYWKDGGVRTIQRVIQNISAVGAQLGNDAHCNSRLAQNVTQALQSRESEDPGNVTHQTFNDSLIDFAVNVYTREFQWPTPRGGAVYQWGTYFENVTTDIQLLGGTRTHTIGAWGLNYTKLPSLSNFTVNLSVPDPTFWKTRLFLEHANGSLDLEEFENGTSRTFQAGAYHEIVFNAVRLKDVFGRFDLTVTLNV